MRTSLGPLIWWIAANLAGVAVFLLWTSSCCWIEPEVSNLPGASAGAALIWMMGPFPMFLVFLLADLGWMAAAAIRTIRTQRWTHLAAPLAILAVWSAALAVDSLHHGV